VVGSGPAWLLETAGAELSGRLPGMHPAHPRYVVDPDDPRAPPEQVWAKLSEAERKLVLASLPHIVPYELHPPEGDLHRKGKDDVRDTLSAHFKRKGRSIYLSSELAVYYPGERRFCPDVLAVLDVGDHDRRSWVVAVEGKGLDLVLEVHDQGDESKDKRENVAFYAHLGIAEYFVFDVGNAELLGWRLPSSRSSRYRRIVPQAGRLASQVLGLQLTVEDDRARFYDGSALLLDAGEVIGRFERKVERMAQQAADERKKRLEAERRAEEEAAARTAAEQERTEEAAARAAAERRADDAVEARKQAEARVAELEKLLGRRRRLSCPDNPIDHGETRRLLAARSSLRGTALVAGPTGPGFGGRPVESNSTPSTCFVPEVRARARRQPAHRALLGRL
jgi:Uma2 family endonuclease